MYAKLWLVFMLATLLAAPALAGAARSSGGPASWTDGQQDKPKRKKRAKKSRTRKKKRDKSKPKKAAGKSPAEPEKAPEWTPEDTVFGPFLWVARQLPDFHDFPKGVEEISLSAVARQGKSMIFVEGCNAALEKKRWVVSACRVVEIREKSFLTKLVEGGADISAAPDSAKRLRDTFKKLRKARTPEKLEPFVLPSSLSNRKGHTSVDDIRMDRDKCGRKAHERAIRSLPLPRFIGTDVLVFDLSYTTGSSSKGHKVRLNAAKTKDGWKLGGLRVHCH